MRTWSLWKTRRWSGFALVVFYLSCWVPIFVIFGTFLINANGKAAHGHFTPSSFLSPLVFTSRPQYDACVVEPGNNNLYLCWVLFMVYDTGEELLSCRSDLWSQLSITSCRYHDIDGDVRHQVIRTLVWAIRRLIRAGAHSLQRW